MKQDTKRYLFICAYGQSRSKWFSQRFMLQGKMSMFCGYYEEADFKLTKEHIEWADIIILLDKHIERTIHYDYIIAKCLDDMNEVEKIYLKYYIDDEPSTFEREYTGLMTELHTNKNE